MKHKHFLALILAGGVSLVGLAESASVPRTWDESALEDWATPVAGLGARPGHFSAAEYYRAPVAYSDASDFGAHRMLSDAQRRVPMRAPDEALYALAQYVYALEPPPNPNASDPRIAAGQQIFAREGCGSCHTPPIYTSNKLTLAEGFALPGDLPRAQDVVRVSVGTDPGLALRTRKGTGFYKVPSLKGVWYRGRYLHDGAVTSLEEMFNPGRLLDDFVPTGFIPAGQKARAVKGHEFGLRLGPAEKGELLAFLRSL